MSDAGGGDIKVDVYGYTLMRTNANPMAPVTKRFVKAIPVTVPRTQAKITDEQIWDFVDDIAIPAIQKRYPAWNYQHHAYILFDNDVSQ
jgi:hypothetical protein